MRRLALLGGLMLGGLTAALAPSAAQAARLQASVEAGPEAMVMVLALSEADTPEVSVEDQEVILRFSSGLEAVGLDALAPQAPDWISYVSAGFDSLLVRFARPVEVTTQADGRVVVLSARPVRLTGEAARADDERRSATLRDSLLRGRLLVEQGHLIKARRLVRGLVRDYPDSAEATAFLATIEQQLGRQRQALWLFNRSLDVNPGDPGVRQAQQRLLDGLIPRAWTDVTWTRVKNADSQVTTIVGADNLPLGRAVFGAAAETRAIDTPTVRRADGTIEPFHGRRSRVQGWVAAPLDPAWEGRVDLFAADGGVGAQGTLTRIGAVDDLDLIAEVQVPQWGYVEGLVDGGARDALRATYRRELTPETSLLLGLGGALYSLDGHAWSGGTLLAQGLLTHLMPLDGGTTLALDYGIDGEYVGFRDTAHDPNGDPFKPVPVVTRETHSLTATLTNVITRGVLGAVYAGYSLNRYGERGLQYGGRLELEPHHDARLELRAGRTATTTRGTGGRTDTLGARFTLLF